MNIPNVGISVVEYNISLSLFGSIGFLDYRIC